MAGKLLLPLALLAVSAGALLLRPVTALQFANDDRGTSIRFPADRGDSFSVTYVHSIYGQPVTEEFTVSGKGELVLTAVRSASGAVLEYFGFDDSRQSHRMHRPMADIVFRVAAGDAQELSIGGRRISFLALGGHGDRITASLTTVSTATLMADSVASWTSGH